VDCITNVPAPNSAVVIGESDNCSVSFISFVSDFSDGNVCNNETITRIYSISDGCANIITVVQLITISATSPLINAGSDQTICEDEEVTLTASNPDGAFISWSNGVTDGLPFIPPIGTTSYTVTGIICGGDCVSVDVVSITVDCFISIDNQEEIIMLYPNPITDKLFVEFPVSSQTTFAIFNLNGQLFASGHLTQSKEEIELSNLPAGNYLVRIINEDSVSLFKVLIK